MAITINNATDFDIEKMTSFNCDKHIEVVTTASLAPTDTHRFIYDIYHNSFIAISSGSDWTSSASSGRVFMCLILIMNIGLS